METLVEDFRGAYNHHILREVLLPELPTPQVAAHVPTEIVHGLVEIGMKYCMLLEDKCDRVNLRRVKDAKLPNEGTIYQEERNALLFAESSILQLLCENMTKEKNSNQGFARACIISLVH